MVATALEASTLLEKKGISAAIVNMHTIKPIDQEQIKKSSDETKFLVSVEEHSILGGLGSSIADVLVSFNEKKKLLKLSLRDDYSPSGDYKFILEKNNLTPETVSNKIIKEFKSI